MKIVVGSDHAGFKLKEHCKALLAAWGHEVTDVGTHAAESVDYPDYGAAVARKVLELGPEARGVAVCGSGIGISMAANKVPGARRAPKRSRAPVRSSGMPSPASSCGNRRCSFHQPYTAIANANAQEAVKAQLAVPAVADQTAQKASVSTIQPIGCAVHCE